jgi:hypothetical protein
MEPAARKPCGRRRSALLAAALAAVAASGCGGPALQTHTSAEVRSSADRTVVLDCGGWAQVAPVELSLRCRRDGLVASSLKWRDWGGQEASAIGFVRDDCVRCPPGSRVRIRISVSKLVLRRDATLAYRSVLVTARRPLPGSDTRELRYELFDGYLELAGEQLAAEQ